MEEASPILSWLRVCGFFVKYRQVLNFVHAFSFFGFYRNDTALETYVSQEFSKDGVKLATIYLDIKWEIAEYKNELAV